MKIVLSLLLVLSTGAALTGCDSSTSSPTSIVSATTPAGWTRQDHYPIGPGEAADFVLFAPAIGSYRDNVEILTSPTSGIPVATAADELIQQALASSSISGVAVDSNAACTVAGLQGRLIQLEFSVVVNGTSYQIVQRQLLAIHSGKDIQILFTRQASNSARAAEFRQVEASLQIN